MHRLFKPAALLLVLAATQAAHAEACSGKLSLDGFFAISAGGGFHYVVKVTNGAGSSVTGDLHYVNFPSDAILKGKTHTITLPKSNSFHVTFGSGVYRAPNAVKLELDRTTASTSGPTIILSNCR